MVQEGGERAGEQAGKGVVDEVEKTEIESARLLLSSRLGERGSNLGRVSTKLDAESALELGEESRVGDCVGGKRVINM